MLLLSGRWYRSKIALDKLKGVTLLGTCREPHVTPDGDAVLVCDFSRQASVVSVDGKPVAQPASVRPIALVPQGTKDNDLECIDLDTRAQTRVEFSLEDLPDLVALVEYDHLPESRRHPDVPKGTKLV
jgi:hypothetical protein